MQNVSNSIESYMVISTRWPVNFQLKGAKVDDK